MTVALLPEVRVPLVLGEGNPNHDELGRFTSGDGGGTPKDGKGRAAAEKLYPESKRLIADAHAWTKTKPWDMTREDVASGKVPGVSYNPGLKNEARNETGKIVLGDKFFDTKHSDVRAQIIWHELGHELADSLANDGTLFELIDAGKMPAELDGQTLGHEVLAQAYALMHSDPEYLQKNGAAIVDAVRTRAEALGLPLPAKAPKPDHSKAFGTEDEYVYHATPKTVPLASFAKKGLMPSTDGMSGPGVYMANKPGETYYHVDPDEAQMIRIRKDDLINEFGLFEMGKNETGVEYDDGTGEVIVGGKRSIPARMLEVQVAGKWKRLSDVVDIKASLDVPFVLANDNHDELGRFASGAGGTSPKGDDAPIERPNRKAEVKSTKDALDKVMAMPTTDDWTRAGFIRPDGKLVNFNKGRTGGLDHGELFPRNPGRLNEVLADGMLRINPDFNGVELGKAPNEAQREQLMKILPQFIRAGLTTVAMHVGLGELDDPDDPEHSRYGAAPGQHRVYTSKAGSTVADIMKDIDSFFERAERTGGSGKSAAPRYDSPLAAFLSLDVPIELGGGNPNHDERGRFASGDGDVEGEAIDTDDRTKSAKGQKLLFDKDSEPARAVVRSPAFKQWFAGSKIVDKQGNPQVVYHGTVAPEDFSVFNVGQPEYKEDDEFFRTGSGGDPTTFLGSHFAAEPETASSFAEGLYGERQGQKEGGRVMPVYLKIEKPFETTEAKMQSDMMRLAADTDAITQVLEEGDDPDARNEQYESDPEFRAEVNQEAIDRELNYDEPSTDTAAELASYYRGELQSKGHDGIIYRNDVEGGTSYVAFGPTQIKSATGNKGEFKPDDPDINASLEVPFVLANENHDELGRFASGGGSGGGKADAPRTIKDVKGNDIPAPPSRLYHVTFAPDAIKKEGFKTGDKTGNFVLGGSDQSHTSFTTAENAMLYRDGMHIAWLAARGEYKADDLQVLISIGSQFGVPKPDDVIKIADGVNKNPQYRGTDDAKKMFEILQQISFKGRKFPLFMGGNWPKTIKEASAPPSIVSAPTGDQQKYSHVKAEQEWRVHNPESIRPEDITIHGDEIKASLDVTFELSEGNPNHDELGRFTSGDGGGGTSDDLSHEEHIDGVPKSVHEWIQDWQFVQQATPSIPSDAMIKWLSKSVPDSTVVLYRAGKKDGDSPKAQAKSWTHERELAEAIVETNDDRKLMKKTVYPDEVLVDFTKLPASYQKHTINEVIVAYGSTLKRMRNLRGTTPTISLANENHDELGRFASGPSSGSKGLPERAATKTPKFKAWFGDSKVVDADGKPKVMYHGTLNDFDEFKTTDEGWGMFDRKLGAHFAEDPEVTDAFTIGEYAKASDSVATEDPEGTWYRDRDGQIKTGLAVLENKDAEGRINREAYDVKKHGGTWFIRDKNGPDARLDVVKPGGRVMATYLSIKNPLVVEPGDKEMDQSAIPRQVAALVLPKDKALFVDAFSTARGANKELVGEMWESLNAGKPYQMGEGKYGLYNSWADVISNYGSTLLNGDGMAQRAKANLKEMGYDGVKYRNTSGNEIAKGGNDWCWIAFDAEQIKSATGNTGEYDPKKKSIKASLDVPIELAGDGEGRWITARGTPVFIKDGQDVKEAINEHFAKARSGKQEKPATIKDVSNVRIGAAVGSTKAEVLFDVGGKTLSVEAKMVKGRCSTRDQNAAIKAYLEKHPVSRTSSSKDDPAPVPVSKMSATTKQWLKSWTAGEDLPGTLRKLSDKIITELAQYVPSKPIKVYRSGYKNETGATQSWTTDREMAKGMNQAINSDHDDDETTKRSKREPERIFKTAKFSPQEILVDTSMMPNGGSSVNGFAEVIVIADKQLMKRVAKIRGELKAHKLSLDVPIELAGKDEGQWITVNGAHILIKDGEGTKEEQVDRFLKGKEKAGKATKAPKPAPKKAPASGLVVRYKGQDYVVTGGGYAKTRGPDKGRLPVVLRPASDPEDSSRMTVVFRDELEGEEPVEKRVPVEKETKAKAAPKAVEVPVETKNAEPKAKAPKAAKVITGGDTIKVMDGKKAITIGPNDWTKDAVAKYQDPEIEKIAKAEGKTVEAITQEWDTKLQAVCDRAKMYVSVPREVVDSILNDGRLKTMAETGTGGGSDDEGPDYRIATDEAMYGYPQSAAREIRPVSGYLSEKEPHNEHVRGKIDGKEYYNGDNHYAALGYGRVRVELKESARARTTVTFGDSLNNQDTATISPLTKVSYRSMRLGEGEEGLDVVKEGSVDAAAMRNDYAEIQVHGGVTLNDIAKIHFPKEPNPATQALLKKTGVTWSVMGAKAHELSLDVPFVLAKDPSYDPKHPEECCPSCGARQERGDDGTCNRCGKPWPEAKKKHPGVMLMTDAFSLSLDVPLVLGDLPGHEFRGNQWTEGADRLKAAEDKMVKTRSDLDALIVAKASAEEKAPAAEAWHKARDEFEVVRDEEAKRPPPPPPPLSNLTGQDNGSRFDEMRKGLHVNKHGRPEGTRDVGKVDVKGWRVGSRDDKYGRGVFYASDAKGAQAYASLHPGDKVEADDLHFDNVLLAGHQNDVSMKLFGKTYAEMQDDLAARHGSEVTGGQKFDVKIAKEAKKRGYDGIVYLSPAPPASGEIVVLGGKKRPSLKLGDVPFSLSEGNPNHDELGRFASGSGVDDQEVKAVGSWSHTLYRASAQAEPTDTEKAELRSFQSALDKVPKYAGTVYRGLVLGKTSDFQGAKLKPNETFSADRPLSSSKSRDEALTFASDSASPKDTVLLMKVQTKDAADISKHVAEEYEDQQEVVLRPGSRYIIDKVTKLGVGSHGGPLVEVTMREADYETTHLKDAYLRKIGATEIKASLDVPFVLANENHDELGRFASGSSGGSARQVVTETHHHDAAVLVSQGIRAGLKPRLNDVEEFAPGRGIERHATYVSDPDSNRGSFGNVRIHFNVPDEQLDIPEEQKQLGWTRDDKVSGLEQAIRNENGAVVRGDVPANKIDSVEVSEDGEWKKYTPTEYLKKYHEVEGEQPKLPTLDEYREVLMRNKDKLFLTDRKVEETVGAYARASYKDKRYFADELKEIEPETAK